MRLLIIIKDTTGHAVHAEQRHLQIDQNFDLFEKILGLGGKGGIKEESMVDALRRKVRAILRVEELTKLRDFLIEQAGAAQ